MTTESQQTTVVDPWQNKSERYWLIAAVVFISYFVFAAYDGKNFYGSYLKLCSEQPGRAECKPLNLTTEKRPPDLGIKLDYEKGKLAIEAGMLQEEAQANNLATQLRSSGIEPRVIRIPGRGKWSRYQVQVGRFPNRTSANEAGMQLQRKGLIQNFRLVDYQTTR